MDMSHFISLSLDRHLDCSIPCLVVVVLNQNLMKSYILHLAVMALISFTLDSASLILEHEFGPCNMFLSVFLFSSATLEEHRLVALERVLIGLSAFCPLTQVANSGNNATWVKLVPPIDHISTHVASNQ